MIKRELKFNLKKLKLKLKLKLVPVNVKKILSSFGIALLALFYSNTSFALDKKDENAFLFNDEKHGEFTKNGFIYRNELQEIHFDKTINFDKRIETIEKIKEAKFIGKLNVNDKQISYSGVYGDIKANNLNELIKKKDLEKKKMLSNTVIENGLTIAFSSNANKYKNFDKLNNFIKNYQKVDGNISTNSNTEKSKGIIVFEMNNKPFVLSIKEEKSTNEIAKNNIKKLSFNKL